MSFHKAFLLSLFIAMGSTLFSCKSHNDASLGEVSVVEDTVQTTHTLGAPLPPKEYDSLVKKEVIPQSPNLKVVKEKHSQINVSTATLGITVVKPLVDSTKTEKK